MSSKFDSVLAEAAYAVAGHGFTEETAGDLSEGTNWEALVVVTSAVLLNLGETEIGERFVASEHAGRDLLVWLREDSQGFVTVVTFGADDGDRSGSDLVNQAWDDAHPTNG